MMIQTKKNNGKNRETKEGARYRLVRIVSTLIFTMAMCVLMLPDGGVLAVDNRTNSTAVSAATAEIPISQTVSGGSADGHYTFTPDPETPDAPMPDGTENGSYSFSLSGTTDTAIEITGSRPGNYYYTLESVRRTESYTYDVTKYRVGVQWINKDGVIQFSSITALADGSESDRKASKIDYKITVPVSAEPVSPVRSSGSSGTVKTGDSNPIGVYISLFAGTGILLVLFFAWRRKKKPENPLAK